MYNVVVSWNNIHISLFSLHYQLRQRWTVGDNSKNWSCNIHLKKNICLCVWFLNYFILIINTILIFIIVYKLHIFDFFEIFCLLIKLPSSMLFVGCITSFSYWWSTLYPPCTQYQLFPRCPCVGESLFRLSKWAKTVRNPTG